MKKLAIAVALCMVLSMVVGGVVFAGNPTTGAGAQKCTLYNSAGYTPGGGASDTSTPTRSFVILNTDANGNLIAQIALKKVTAGTYDVYINHVLLGVIIYQDNSPSGAIATLSTNAQGNGNAHYNVPAAVDAAGNRATDFWVSVIDWVSGTTLRTTAVMLD